MVGDQGAALAEAIALYRAERFDQAEVVCREIIASDPTFGPAWERLAHIFGRTGRRAEAIAYFEEAIRRLPDPAEAHNNLAVILHEAGDLEAALPHYRQAVALGLQHPLLHSNLGCLLRDLGHLQDGVDQLVRAVEMDPDLAHGHSNLGVTLCLQARADQALPHLRLATALKPDWDLAWSNLLFCLNYVDNVTPAQVSAIHRLYGARFADPEHHRHTVPDPERRLRVGLVSPDFKRHSVSYFLEPLLASHDPERVEYIAYANVVRPDAVTDRLQTHVERWRSIVGVSDEDVARLIYADRIDILIDLAGHTANNRLALFARRPAPVQMTYLGYANSTGLREIDWRITDPWADPPGMTERLHSEELLRLPDGFLCYRPREPSPPVAPPPVGAAGRITFGSFNLLAKVSPTVIDLWARILASVPTARLLIKGPAFADPRTRAAFQARLAETPLGAHDVQLLPHLVDENDHLATYDQVDIALDTWPYHGTTTTCEALWMGVPVVTLAGRTHASRVGASLLTRVGLPELVTTTAEQYVAIAAGFAADRARLTSLRRSLRGRMTTAGLIDAPRHARAFEAGLRQAWRAWCRREQARTTPPEPGTAHLTITNDIQVAVADTLEEVTPYVLLERRDWFEDELPFVRIATARGERVIDIGADHGVYALSLAARVGVAGRVWAFEAEPGVSHRLRQSIQANGFENIVLGALSTLDAHTKEFGIRDVALVRLDAKTAEPAVLEGGQRFFSDESPLLMFKVRQGADIHRPTLQAVSRMGYDVYRLIPGLDLLAPVSDLDTLDPYQLNLFACKADRASTLAERGLLVQNAAPAEEAPQGTWVMHLRPFPIAVALGARWRGPGDTMQAYFRALDHYALAHRQLDPPATRLAHLMKAVEDANTALGDAMTIPALQTVARVAYEAGYRSIAVQALNVLVQRCQDGSTLAEDLPFLPACPRFDGIKLIDDDVRRWVLAGALEQRERLRAFSSFYTTQDPETLASLEAIAKLGYQSPEMARRLSLVKQRRGLGP